MNTRINTWIGAALLLVATIGFTACNQSGGETASAEESKSGKIEIANLLPRSGKVGAPSEANKMANTYSEIRNQIEKDPKNYGARLKMADLFIVEARATGNYNYYYPAAISMIDGVLEENPQDPDDQFRAYTSKAVILLSLHKFEDALKMGEKALAINPYNSRVYGILTDANVELGHYEKAVEMADSMVAKRPDLRSYSRVSYLREIYGDVEGAEKAMEMAIKAGYPGHEETSWSRVTLGRLHENYGDLEAAEMQYQQALQERPGYPFALQGLASVEAKKENYAKAEELLKEAIDLRPEASFYEDLALVYQKEDKQPEMKKAKEKAFSTLKGMALEGDKAKGKEDEGGSLFTHTKQQAEHGHSHEVGLDMAKMHLSLGDDYEQALHNAQHAYDRRPDNIEINRELAYVYYKTGDLEKAQQHLEKATATQSKDPKLMMIGGLIAMKKGNQTKGRKMLQESFTVNPYQNGVIAMEAKSKLGNKSVAGS